MVVEKFDRFFFFFCNISLMNIFKYNFELTYFCCEVGGELHLMNPKILCCVTKLFVLFILENL